jgi:glycosyltransferase involved in cell wall biosynthesis
MITPMEVSVVMSVYNGEQYLAETIESILHQENVVFEFIVVNDGSTDKSAEIIDYYAKQDTRIRVICQDNQGLTKALIKGCSEAKGLYIARQDVGDISLPGRLRIQKDAIDADAGLAFVSCWTEFCGPRGEFLFLVKGTGRAATPSSIISRDEKKGTVDGPSHHGAVMFRRDVYSKVGGYREEFYFGQDWDLWYRLAERGTFQVVGQTLYRALVTPGSLSGDYREAQERLASLSRAALMRRLDGRRDEDILRDAAKIRKRDNHGLSWVKEAAWLYFIGECLRRNGDARAFSYLWKAVRTNPVALRTWVRLGQLVASRIMGSNTNSL